MGVALTVADSLRGADADWVPVAVDDAERVHCVTVMDPLGVLDPVVDCEVDTVDESVAFVE